MASKRSQYHKYMTQYSRYYKSIERIKSKARSYLHWDNSTIDTYLNWNFHANGLRKPYRYKEWKSAHMTKKYFLKSALKIIESNR